MYEEIRKPRLLKDVPLLLIRALPSIYYYTKNFQYYAPKQINNYFITQAHFLSEALTIIGERLTNEKLSEVAASLKEIELNPNQNRNLLNELTIKLSGECSKQREPLRALIRELKPELIDLYGKNVEPLKIAVVENNCKAERVKKLIHLLQDFCYYKTELIDWQYQDGANSVLASDFVVFASIQSPQIHNQVKFLQAYKKPGLAAAFLDEEREISLRHGMQLMKAGFPVLYKVFTPIRLFTTIDKAYILYHMQKK